MPVYLTWISPEVCSASWIIIASKLNESMKCWSPKRGMKPWLWCRWTSCVTALCKAFEPLWPMRPFALCNLCEMRKLSMGHFHPVAGAFWKVTEAKPLGTSHFWMQRELEPVEGWHCIRCKVLLVLQLSFVVPKLLGIGFNGVDQHVFWRSGTWALTRPNWSLVVGTPFLEKSYQPVSKAETRWIKRRLHCILHIALKLQRQMISPSKKGKNAKCSKQS